MPTFTLEEIDRVKEIMTDLQSVENLLANFPNDKETEQRRNDVLHRLQMHFGRRLQQLVDDGMEYPPVVFEAKKKLLDYLRSTGALDTEYPDDADEELTDLFSATDLIQGQGHDDGDGHSSSPWSNN